MNKITTVPAGAPVDWDGQARPNGATDVGADEFAASTPAPSAPTNVRIVK
jgi:hypothetical protein